MTKNTTSDAGQMRNLTPKDFDARARFLSELMQAPIPPEELMHNLPLFQDRRLIAQILFVNEIYQKIVGLHGNIFEFGVRYGPKMALFTSLRGIYEPMNPNRKVVGFDTFGGFPSVHRKHDLAKVKAGDFAVTENYEAYLEKMLLLHESMAPIENQKKFELVKGDATKTVKKYLVAHPETIISLAYFDFDLYEPTKVCLEAILPYLTKGAVIVFDEINLPDWPGETVALREVLGTGKFRLVHSPYRAAAAYLIYE
jgi:hypothetical protein